MMHVISRTNWFEPSRLRQQLTKLLAFKYDVNYHFPHDSLDGEKSSPQPNISLSRFNFVARYASLPIVSIINAVYLYCYLRRVLRRGDVIINFLPELMFIPRVPGVKVISVINDDFASMAPRVSAWWIRFLMRRMAANADATLYVSSQLMRLYPGKQPLLFYPWADKQLKGANRRGKRNVILYWGYLSGHFDFRTLEQMAREISDLSLDLRIRLVGPADEKGKREIEGLVSKYRCIAYEPPTALENLDVDSVLFGVELLSPGFRNASVVEFPNKAPRLLSYGIPLVYSGCELMDSPFFIKYKGDVEKISREVLENGREIEDAIERYFLENNSATRLRDLEKLL